MEQQQQPADAPAEARVLTAEDVLAILHQMQDTITTLSNNQNALQGNQADFQARQEVSLNQMRAGTIGMAQPQAGAQDREWADDTDKVRVPEPFFHANEEDLITFDQFVIQLKMAIAAQNLKYPKSLYYAVNCFKGKAQALISQYCDSEEKCRSYHNMDHFLQTIRVIFVSPAHQTAARAKFESRIQNENEPLATYHADIRSLAVDAFPRESPAPDATLIDKFVSGLLNSSIRYEMLKEPITNYNVALERAMHIASLHDINRIYDQRTKFPTKNRTEFPTTVTGMPSAFIKKNVQPPQGEPMEIGAFKPNNPNNSNQGPRKYCRLHKTTSHSDAECQAQKKAGFSQHNPNRNAPNMTKSSQGPKSNDQARGKPKTGDTCRNCGGRGHWARQCPSPKKAPTNRNYALEADNGAAMQDGNVNETTDGSNDNAHNNEAVHNDAWQHENSGNAM